MIVLDQQFCKRMYISMNLISVDKISFSCLKKSDYYHFFYTVDNKSNINQQGQTFKAYIFITFGCSVGILQQKKVIQIFISCETNVMFYVLNVAITTEKYLSLSICSEMRYFSTKIVIYIY